MAQAATAQSSQNPAEAAFSREWGVALALLLALLVTGLLAFLDSGVRGLGLLLLGAVLGGVFLYFQYGFASGWRAFLERGQMMGLSAHFLLAALCALVFIPAASLGLSATGALAPVSVSLFIGAFMFGIGMQLANGCGSGVLFSFWRWFRADAGCLAVFCAGLAARLADPAADTWLGSAEPDTDRWQPAGMGAHRPEFAAAAGYGRAVLAAGPQAGPANARPAVACQSGDSLALLGRLCAVRPSVGRYLRLYPMGGKTGRQCWL